MLAFCYAGCQQAQIVTELKERGLWPEYASYSQEIVAEYDYHDASGKFLYQAVRFAPKDFKQRRLRTDNAPRTDSNWLWSLGDTPRVPYRLPDLLKAMSADPDCKHPYWIVEGEKDVDRLWAMDLYATCNVGGAGKWRRDYADYFKGRVVVIVIDRDDAGRTHGKQVASSLQGIAKRVLWLELPGNDNDHGDVSDYLDDGGTKDELRKLAQHAPGPPDGLEAQRESSFKRAGLGFVYAPADAPVSIQFTRLADHKDETTAEVTVVGMDGHPIVRRRINLLGASGIPRNLIDVLEGAGLGVDTDVWQKVIGAGFESVLAAHRDGLVLDFVEGDIKPPPPQAWLCDTLIQKGKLNCWLGAAGTGKSTLAKGLVTYYACGEDFLDKKTDTGVPLYLDWEDDREDFERAVHDVCRSIHHWPIPKMAWVKMRGKRLRDAVESITRYIEEFGFGLLIVDSIAASGGAAGEHRSYEDLALEIEQCLGQLPPITVLALDHITSVEHKRGNKGDVPVKARGAERKVEIYRNQWTWMRDDEEAERGRHLVTAYHTKINNGPTYQPFTVEIKHQAGELSIQRVEFSASPEAMERETYPKQIEHYVADNPGITPKEVLAGVPRERGVEKSQLAATDADLRRLMKRGVLERDVSGRYWPHGHPEMPRQLGNLLSSDPGDLPW